MYHKIGHWDDFKNDSIITYFHDDREILIAKIHEEIFAVDNICSHAEGQLCKGSLINDEIECPMHGARFNLKTGDPTQGPALLPIDTFNLQISTDGDILIEL